MVMGDRNTSFYHIFALARRKMNTITMVKNEVWDWLSGEREVMTHFKEGFIRSYSTTQVKADWRHNLRHGWQVSLTKEEKNNLDQPISNEEIASALWSLKAFKAPGPNGLHAGFFQRFWLIIGNSVKEEIRNVSYVGNFRIIWTAPILSLFPRFKAQSPLVVTNLLVCATRCIKSSLKL